MDLVFLKDYTLPELETWVESIGERPYRARQLFKHIYARRVRSWEECSDLSKMFRAQLQYGTRLDAVRLVEKVEAADATCKYLFALSDGLLVESVLIPDPPRFTACLSSQVGCALGCRFCLTGSLGFTRNLRTAEIVDQLCCIQQDLGTHPRITNIVFMGMGEPLANYDAVVRAMRILLDPNGLAFSHRRITLSTVGLVPQLRRLGRELPVNLAVSLHAPDDALRSELMPINRVHPLAELLAACREYPLPARKRITFEVILMAGVNDDLKTARRLVRLLSGVRAKVNLIPFNSHPEAPFRPPAEDQVLAFQEVLQQAQITTLIRHRRGSDIGAACGQLAARGASQGR